LKDGFSVPRRWTPNTFQSEAFSRDERSVDPCARPLAKIRMSPDLPLAMIATRDIGAAAADFLSKLDFSGKQSRELLGPRDVSYSEIAKVVGAAIGKPDLTYKQFSSAQLKPVLTQMGMSSNMVDLLLEMTDSLNSGYMKALEQRSPKNTTPTTIETFVTEVFVPAYRGKAASA